MSKTIVLSITSLTTIVAGKFVSNFAVVDQDGELVGRKAHATQEAAQVELDSLKHYATALDYARLTAKEGTADKALVGKANTIAAYLAFEEQGGAEAFLARKAEAEAKAAEAEAEAEAPVTESEEF